MPSGIANGPSTLQHAKEDNLFGYHLKICNIHLDDVCFDSYTWRTSLNEIQIVFHSLHQASFILKPTKCYFLKRKIEYFDLMVLADRIAPI